jgi:hypothetical protein
MEITQLFDSCVFLLLQQSPHHYDRRLLHSSGSIPKVGNVPTNFDQAVSRRRDENAMTPHSRHHFWFSNMID